MIKVCHLCSKKKGCVRLSCWEEVKTKTYFFPKLVKYCIINSVHQKNNSRCNTRHFYFLILLIQQILKIEIFNGADGGCIFWHVIVFWKRLIKCCGCSSRHLILFKQNTCMWLSFWEETYCRAIFSPRKTAHAWVDWKQILELKDCFAFAWAKMLCDRHFEWSSQLSPSPWWTSF